MDTYPGQSRESRERLDGRLEYACGEPNSAGFADWRNVSRTGGSVRLGRYLRPGREIAVWFESPLAAEQMVRVRARIQWCRPSGTPGAFTAGLAIIRDTPEQALAYAALSQAAREQSNKRASAPVSHPVWTRFKADTGQSQPAAEAHCAHAV